MTAEYRLIWTNLILVGWLIIFIPLFGLLKQPPLNNFIGENINALECVFLGINHGDYNCQISGLVLFATIIIAAIQMHSQIILSRSESGPFATMVLSLSPFLADIIFASNFIM